MSFFRNLAGVLLTSAVSAPVGLLTSVLLARYLSTDDRGLYALAVSFAMVATIIFQQGWPTASIYRLRGAQVPPAQVSGAALLFFAGSSVVVIAGSLLLEPVLRERFLSGLPPAVYLLALATVPLRMLANGYGSIARGIDRFRYENWYAFALQVGNLIAVALALVWLGGALTELMWVLLGVYAVLVLGLIIAVLRETGISFSLRPREMRRSFRFGMKTYAMSLTGRVHERVDVFMLAYLLAEPSQIAFYAIAKGAIQILQLLPNALGKVAYPQLAGLGPEEAARFACALVRQGLIFMFPSSVVLFAAASILLPLVYGEAYGASVLPFQLMLPGVVLLGMDYVLSRYFTGTNQHKANVITRCVALAVNIGLNLIMIPRFGIAGAAAAALVSYAVAAILLVIVFLSMTECRLRDLLWVRREDLEPYKRQLLRLSQRLRAEANRARP